MAFASVGRRTIKIRSKLEAVGEIRLDARFERPCPGRTTSSRRPYADHLSQSGSIPMSEAGSIPMSVKARVMRFVLEEWKNGNWELDKDITEFLFLLSFADAVVRALECEP
jgi:hypothetical protein